MAIKFRYPGALKGSWPVRPKTIFDAKARRISCRASEKIDHAKQYINRTSAVGAWWDAVVEEGDLDSWLAFDLLDQALARVGEAERLANEAAKALDSK